MTNLPSDFPCLQASWPCEQVSRLGCHLTDYVPATLEAEKGLSVSLDQELDGSAKTWDSGSGRATGKVGDKFFLLGEVGEQPVCEGTAASCCCHQMLCTFTTLLWVRELRPESIRGTV